MLPPAFNHYMTFKSPVANPWDPAFVAGQYGVLGGRRLEVITSREMMLMRGCYDPPSDRREQYGHGPDHGAFMGQPDLPTSLRSRLTHITEAQAKAMLVIAGLTHDVVMPHVDAVDAQGRQGWAEYAHKRIGDWAQPTVQEGANGRLLFVTTLNPDAVRDNPYCQMAARQFAYDDQGLTHLQGGNELASALVAARLSELIGIEPRFAIGITALIAATVPFRPARGNGPDQNPDGYMGDLYDRAMTITLTHDGVEHRLDPGFASDLGQLYAHFSLRDVHRLMQPESFSAAIAAGRAIQREEVWTLRGRITNIEQLVEAVRPNRSAPFLYQSMARRTGHLLPENAPHFFMPRNAAGQLCSIDMQQAYPPFPIYEAAADYTKINAILGNLFSQVHDLGVVVTACIATCCGEPQAPVPGFVKASMWRPQAQPVQAQTLNPWESTLYAELMFGENQEDVRGFVSKRSPTAGLLAAVLKFNGIERMAARVHDIREEAAARGIAHPFSDPDIAAAFVEEIREAIGPENFRIITTELHLVAEHFQNDADLGNPERMAKLEALGGGLAEYDGFA
jgi:hypothetical protein